MRESLLKVRRFGKNMIKYYHNNYKEINSWIEENKIDNNYIENLLSFLGWSYDYKFYLEFYLYLNNIREPLLCKNCGKTIFPNFNKKTRINNDFKFCSRKCKSSFIINNVNKSKDNPIIENLPEDKVRELIISINNRKGFNNSYFIRKYPVIKDFVKNTFGEEFLREDKEILELFLNYKNYKRENLICSFHNKPLKFNYNNCCEDCYINISNFSWSGYNKYRATRYEYIVCLILEEYNINFKSQVQYSNKFRFDFVINNIILELDDSSHNEIYDSKKDNFIKTELKYNIIRIKYPQGFNFEYVIDYFLTKLRENNIIPSSSTTIEKNNILNKLKTYLEYVQSRVQQENCLLEK